MHVSRIEDLEKIRGQTSLDLTLQQGGPRTKINLHLGTCGIAAGANRLESLINREIEEKGLRYPDHSFRLRGPLQPRTDGDH
jgi:hypothetical protein